MRGAAAVAIGLLWVFRPTPSLAAPFDLEWSAPPECPSRERIMAATRERLGEHDTTAAPDLEVRGSVSFEDDAIVVVLHMRDAEGAPIGDRTVRVDASSCEAIEAPTSLVLAMMITVARPHGPAATTESPPAPTEPPPPPSFAAVPARRKPARSNIEPRVSGPPVTGSLVLAGVSSVGLLPRVGLGGALRSTATLGSRFLVGVETSFETSRTKPDGATGEATMTLVDLGLLGGMSIARSGWFEIAPVLGVRGGVLTASASGFPLIRTSERVVGIVAAGMLGRFSLGRALRLEVLPEVRAPLARDEFQIRKGAELIHVHQSSFVAFRLSAGIGWEFR